MTADELQGQITAYATSAYVASMQAASAQLDSVTHSANQLYVKAAAQAGAEAGVIGSEKALRHALNTLASQGVSVSTYTRKDGTVVHTPVDVGVRRMINDELRQRNIQQVRELAQELGRNYVEVSITANCRESHEPWQGQIYSLEPDDDTYPYFDTACNVGDPVDGFGGYNCGHQIHIYRPEIGRTFTDPLEGTGYTTEEVRALTTKQRALENNIRKTKREIECLKAAGLDTTAESAKLRNYQQQLSTLLKENSAVLTSGGAYRTEIDPAKLAIERMKNRVGITSKVLDLKDVVRSAYERSEEAGLITIGTWSKDGNALNFVPISMAERYLDLHSVEYVSVSAGQVLSDEEIIKKLAGLDHTRGSCVSQAVAYVANTLGLDVTDFRGGKSCDYFASNLYNALDEIGASISIFEGKLNESQLWNEAKKSIMKDKIYILETKGTSSTSGHAAVVKKEGSQYYYLELQPSLTNGSSGWKTFERDTIAWRFVGTTSLPKQVRSERTINLYDTSTIDKTELQRLCGYINTK